MNLYALLPAADLRSCCFVWLGYREANMRTMDEIAFTTAHEIGHLLLGAGHPDEEGGEAPFPSLQLADTKKPHVRGYVSSKTVTTVYRGLETSWSHQTDTKRLN